MHLLFYRDLQMKITGQCGIELFTEVQVDDVLFHDAQVAYQYTKQIPSPLVSK